MTRRKCTFFNRLPFGFPNALSMGMKSSFHRRLRPIAPGFLYGFSSGPAETLARTATNPLASRKIATELDRCCTGVPCGLAAADFRSRRAVMPDEEKQHRVSQPAGICPGIQAHDEFLPSDPGYQLSSKAARPLLWLRSASSVMGVVRPEYLLIVTLGIFQLNEP